MQATSPTPLTVALGACFVLVVGSCDSSTDVSLPEPGGPWPDNEPSGLVPVFPGHPTVPGVLVDGSHYKFDYTGAGGSDLGTTFTFPSGKWDGGPRILSTTEAESRYANVIRKNFFIGDVSGWNGIAYDDEFPADYESLYFRMIFKLSANYDFTWAEKFFYFGEANGPGNAFALHMSSRRLAVTDQSTNAGDSGEWRSSKIINADVCITLELIINAQSVVGVSDGSFQVFVDNMEVTDFTWLGGGGPAPQNAVNWYESGAPTRLFSGAQLFQYWGGVGDTKTANDHIDISEFYITGISAIN